MKLHNFLFSDKLAIKIYVKALPQGIKILLERGVKRLLELINIFFI